LPQAPFDIKRTLRVIEQALFVAKDGGGFTCLGRSPGFSDDWLLRAEELCAGFGAPPEGAACGGSFFAMPFERRGVAVVQVAGQGKDGLGPLAFRFLILPRALYADLHGDLFRVNDVFPPAWETRGDLPALDWTAGPPQPRAVADVQSVLNVPYSATLLGGVQVLLDGGRLVFERTAPDQRLVRSLWALLPNSNRCELWPATFAFGNTLGFDIAVVPRAEGPGYDRYVTEEQAGDYPEGRYEVALQVAAEEGQQDTLDQLFARRSRSQTMRLGLILLALFITLPLTNLFCGPPPAPPTTAKAETKKAK
jgi:hypothetical protein